MAKIKITCECGHTAEYDESEIHSHRLMCGDSTSVDDVDKLVDGAQMDMLLTDPPYNVDYSEKAKNLAQVRPNRRVQENNLTEISNDKMDKGEFREFLFDAFATARTVMKPGAVFHVWHSEWESVNFRCALADAGLQCRQELIWIKNNISLGKQDFQRQYEAVLTGDSFLDEEMLENGYEPCLYGWKDGKGHKWFKKRKEKDVLFFDKPRASAEHPTMKPILLFNYEMQCNTKPGDAVLDLFSGSGTTLMACEQNGRTAYCMELDPKYVDVIINRWERFTGQEAVLLNGNEED